MSYAPSMARVIRMLKFTGTEQAVLAEIKSFSQALALIRVFTDCLCCKSTSKLIWFRDTRTSDTNYTVVDFQFRTDRPSSCQSPSAPHTIMAVHPMQAAGA